MTTVTLTVHPPRVNTFRNMKCYQKGVGRLPCHQPGLVVCQRMVSWGSQVWGWSHREKVLEKWISLQSLCETAQHTEHCWSNHYTQTRLVTAGLIEKKCAYQRMYISLMALRVRAWAFAANFWRFIKMELPRDYFFR